MYFVRSSSVFDSFTELRLIIATCTLGVSHINGQDVQAEPILIKQYNNSASSLCNNTMEKIRYQHEAAYIGMTEMNRQNS